MSIAAMYVVATAIDTRLQATRGSFSGSSIFTLVLGFSSTALGDVIT